MEQKRKELQKERSNPAAPWRIGKGIGMKNRLLRVHHVNAVRVHPLMSLGELLHVPGVVTVVAGGGAPRPGIHPTWGRIKIAKGNSGNYVPCNEVPSTGIRLISMQLEMPRLYFQCMYEGIALLNPVTWPGGIRVDVAGARMMRGWEARVVASQILATTPGQIRTELGRLGKTSDRQILHVGLDRGRNRRILQSKVEDWTPSSIMQYRIPTSNTGSWLLFAQRRRLAHAAPDREQPPSEKFLRKRCFSRGPVKRYGSMSLDCHVVGNVRSTGDAWTINSSDFVRQLTAIFDKAIIISQWRSITVSSTLAESGEVWADPCGRPLGRRKVPWSHVGTMTFVVLRISAWRYWEKREGKCGECWGDEWKKTGLHGGYTQL
ncbi:uncharacterized protein BO96DRAFT_430745 [Aspergillus niger CBS 101883]|uniref:uncharacterized protein n=1 Tax=Aspergillus lacticoffeatus (strain CBS 101883) TaxID=1450533 RepID=UPI000D805300|nr:uncharacterized protein BO96DRAFT_430745 [Aspergillus niger CBS 101883]PYH60838.1 hypothetical protein BO96DRAFT_430745 [Aspergillus niger CBS 101883]